MIGLSPEGIKVWDDRLDEIIKCGEPINTPEIEEWKRRHPLPTDDELEEIFRRYEE